MHEHCEFALLCGDPANNLGEDAIAALLAPERGNAMRSYPEARVVREDKITWQGCPGQDIEIRGANGRVCLIRGILVTRGRKKQVYQLRTAGKDIRADAGDAAKFFGSFRLDEDKDKAADAVPGQAPK
jgi:hypothetical protein